MAKVEQYRQIIQELLEAYSQIKSSNEEVEAEVIFDRERDRYPSFISLRKINEFSTFQPTKN